MRDKESKAQAAKPVFRDAPQQWEEIIAKWIWPESSVASLVQRYRRETANMAISEFADWVMGQMARTRDIEKNASLELATIDWLYDFVRANVIRGRVFDLGEVLSQGSADCIGYAKLFTLLARRFGLDTGIIEVLADNAGRHLPHTINLVRLSNKERRFVDLWYGSKNINHQRVAIQVREEGIWREKDVDRDELSILEDIKALPDECADAITLYIQGNRRLNEGEYDSAIRCYSEAIRLYPTNARFYFNRAVAYDNKGELENAEVDYAQALKDSDSLIRVLAKEHEEVIQLIELDAKQISPRDQQIYLFHKGFLTGEEVPLDQVAREFYMSEDEVSAALSCCEAPQ